MNENDEYELTKNIKEYKNLREEIKELKNKREELRTLILTTIKIHDITKYDTGTEVLFLNSSSRKTFNKDKALAFLELHKEDTNEYFTENEYEVLKINAKEVYEK